MNLDSLIKRFGANTPLFGARQPEIGTETVLKDAIRMPNGAFHFRAHLAKGLPYVVHASSDLKTWNPVLNGISSGEPMSFSDSHASRFSHRFYRLVAGNEESSNILGYVSISLPPGFSMISNPLDSSTNAVARVFKDWPDGTTFNKFDTGLFRLVENGIRLGRWINSAEALKPGEGAIVFNPTVDHRTICFTGEVLQKEISVVVPAGYSIRSSLLPRAGHITEDLKFPVSDGDVIHVFDRQKQQYVLYPYENGRWTSGAPVLAVGEAFWVAKAKEGVWDSSGSQKTREAKFAHN